MKRLAPVRRAEFIDTLRKLPPGARKAVILFIDAIVSVHAEHRDSAWLSDVARRYPRQLNVAARSCTVRSRKAVRS